MLKVKNKMYLHLQSMVRSSFECMDAVKSCPAALRGALPTQGALLLLT